MDDLLSPADRIALADLAARYALAVDNHDFAALSDVFTPDCVLDTGRSKREGVDQVIDAMQGLLRYESTAHLVAQQLATGGPDHAVGVTYCTAHHLTNHGDDHRTDKVMHIRYHDNFVRTGEGWRIANRRLEVQWTNEAQVA